MLYTWLVLTGIFVIAEAVTVGLAAVWFALGSAAALVVCLLGGQTWLQIVTFAVVSVVTLIFTRPLVKKYVNSRCVATNADRALAQNGVVSEEIDNLLAKGTVTVDGKVWSARSADGSVIGAGTVVKPVRIEGVKLIVEPAADPAGENH